MSTMATKSDDLDLEKGQAPVKNVVTSPEGRYAAFISDTKLTLYRVDRSVKDKPKLVDGNVPSINLEVGEVITDNLTVSDNGDIVLVTTNEKDKAKIDFMATKKTAKDDDKGLSKSRCIICLVGGQTQELKDLENIDWLTFFRGQTAFGVISKGYEVLSIYKLHHEEKEYRRQCDHALDRKDFSNLTGSYQYNWIITENCHLIQLFRHQIVIYDLGKRTQLLESQEERALNNFYLRDTVNKAGTLLATVCLSYDGENQIIKVFRKDTGLQLGSVDWKISFEDGGYVEHVCFVDVKGFHLLALFTWTGYTALLDPFNLAEPKFFKPHSGIQLNPDNNHDFSADVACVASDNDVKVFCLSQLGDVMKSVKPREVTRAASGDWEGTGYSTEWVVKHKEGSVEISATNVRHRDQKINPVIISEREHVNSCSIWENDTLEVCIRDHVYHFHCKKNKKNSYEVCCHFYKERNTTTEQPEKQDYIDEDIDLLFENHQALKRLLQSKDKDSELETQLRVTGGSLRDERSLVKHGSHFLTRAMQSQSAVHPILVQNFIQLFKSSKSYALVKVLSTQLPDLFEQYPDVATSIVSQLSLLLDTQETINLGEKHLDFLPIALSMKEQYPLWKQISSQFFKIVFGILFGIPPPFVVTALKKCYQAIVPKLSLWDMFKAKKQRMFYFTFPIEVLCKYPVTHKSSVAHESPDTDEHPDKSSDAHEFSNTNESSDMLKAHESPDTQSGTAFSNFVSLFRRPEYSNFIKLVEGKNMDFFHTWEAEAIINQKWNAFGKFYHLVSWLGYIAYVACFSAAILVEDNDVAKGLFIATLILAWWQVQVELRDMLFTKHEYFKSFENCVDIWAYILPSTTAIKYLNDDPAGDALIVMSLFFIWLRFLYFFHPYESFGVYIAIIVGVVRSVFPFLFLLFLATFAYAQMFFMMLRPPPGADDPNSQAVNSPWMLTARYSEMVNGTVTDNTVLVEQPGGNTNMFAGFDTALMATYRFLTGDTSYISAWELKSNPLLALMMTIFSFLSVIYLLNLFIGLLGSAIGECQERAQFLQKKSEILRGIELLYMYPSDRSNTEYFPKTMYYQALADAVKTKFSSDETVLNLGTSFKQRRIETSIDDDTDIEEYYKNLSADSRSLLDELENRRDIGDAPSDFTLKDVLDFVKKQRKKRQKEADQESL